MYKSGIYKITNVINNKCYIGSAVYIKKRWANHKNDLNSNKHHSVILQRAWNKYGEENFKFEILFYCNKEDLIVKEQKQIDWFKPEYNVAKIAGNMLGFKHSKEFCDKVSKRMTGNKYTLGRSLSPDHKLKLLESTKDKKLSEEHKEKLRKANTGRIPTKETLLKMSESQKGNQNWLGKNHTEESKTKISAAKKGVKQFPETIAKRIATRKRNKELNFWKIIKL